MIFIYDDTFNILAHDSYEIKNQEGRRYFGHRHFRLHYETFYEKRLRYSSGTRWFFHNPSMDHKCRINIDSPKTVKIATRR